MPTFNVAGWIWAGTGSPTTLSLVTITDDDPNLSPYFTTDLTETITIGGTTYTNPRAGTYNLSFNDSGGSPQNEDFLLFSTGVNFIFVPLPGSNFDNGSVVTGLGGWQQYTTGFAWTTVMCFARDSQILTLDGQIPVQDLNAGDHVITRDRGAQPIRWIGHKSIRFADLCQENADKLRPIRICAGSLGADQPAQDLLVSPQHRILVQSRICQRMFDSDAALVAAKNLTVLPGVYRDEAMQGIDYYHILLDRHEIIYAEGLPAESLLTGPMALQSVSPEARTEILALFPDIEEEHQQAATAATIPRQAQQRRLLQRHVKNNKPMSSVSPTHQDIG